MWICCETRFASDTFNEKGRNLVTYYLPPSVLFMHSLDVNRQSYLLEYKNKQLLGYDGQKFSIIL